MHRKHQGKMYCFSPPVMLATFLIEFSLALYTVWRYKMTTVTRLAVGILLALGIFQLAEYMICGGLGLTNIDWARAGYASITLLPALGIHMLVAISGKKMPGLIRTAYATCIAFVGFYVLNTGSISGHTCASNYAIFYTESFSAQLFTIYYYGWLMVGTVMAWMWGMEKPEKRVALHSMMIGYLVFIVPTTAFNIVEPSTISGIPSIMCGFAVLLAVIISGKVLPSMPNLEPRTEKVKNEVETTAS